MTLIVGARAKSSHDALSGIPAPSESGPDERIQHDLQMVMHRSASLSGASSRQMTLTPLTSTRSLPATVPQLSARMTTSRYCP